MAKILLIGLLCNFIGYYFGWVYAHITVAAECERLGGFYVGKKIYKCHLVQEADTTQQQGDTNE